MNSVKRILGVVLIAALVCLDLWLIYLWVDAARHWPPSPGKMNRFGAMPAAPEQARFHGPYMEVTDDDLDEIHEQRLANQRKHQDEISDLKAKIKAQIELMRLIVEYRDAERIGPPRDVAVEPSFGVDEHHADFRNFRELWKELLEDKP